MSKRAHCPWCGRQRRPLPDDKHDAQTRLDMVQELEQLMQTKGYIGMLTAMRRIRDRESQVRYGSKT